MKTYGYCRISRAEQNIERQERNIRAVYPDAIIIKETFTGTKTSGRKLFTRLINTADSSTRIVFDSVSRMSRNADEGFQIYQDLFARGVELVFLKEPHINTETYKASLARQIILPAASDNLAVNELIISISDAVNRYMLSLAKEQIRLAFEQSEKEVSDLRQRTREGVETARLAGKQIGGVPGRTLHIKKSVAAKKKILQYSRDFGGTLSDVDAMKIIGIAYNTYYKYKRQLKEEFSGRT